MPQGAVSNGKHIDTFIPPHLRDMFYRHPTRPYVWNNGLDPYGFSTEGLVLYLPLWALKGSTFKSVDAYQHLNTVTGALWRPDGRFFDGLDDEIDMGTPASLQITGDQTYAAWIFPEEAAVNQQVLARGDFNTGSTLLWDGANGRVASEITDASGAFSTLNGSTTGNAVDNWYFIAFTWVASSGLFTIYLDGADDGSKTFNAGGTTKLATVNCFVGRRATTGFFEGRIGEGWEYNRALSTGELSRMRNTTTWRYQ